MLAEPSDDHNAALMGMPSPAPRGRWGRMGAKTWLIGVAAIAVGILAYQSFYTVAEYERVVLTTWGQFDKVVQPACILSCRSRSRSGATPSISAR
jgi:regulator of protease activity HflC (stomatin/prohibitin superfamily)